jgi:hypothetical protein
METPYDKLQYRLKLCYDNQGFRHVIEDLIDLVAEQHREITELKFKLQRAESQTRRYTVGSSAYKPSAALISIARDEEHKRLLVYEHPRIQRTVLS